MMVSWKTVWVTILPLIRAASLVRINETLPNNPTKVGFYIYVPDQLADNPAILVNPHWCHGDARSAYAGSQFARLASKNGFIVIYPDSPNAADKCWDVSSSETLTHNGGGDSLGIVSMVNWTLAKYDADASRVFVTGVSSGAMMTNVLIGAYPDVFAGGSAFAGVAFGCFAAGINNTANYDYWNSECAGGDVTHTPGEWAAIVGAAWRPYPPGYNGWRPKMQVFHGTADETLHYANFGEEIKEWTAVLGLSQTPTSTTPNTPLRGWTKYAYGADGWFEAYSALNVTHNIPVQENEVVKFFDLTCTPGDCFRWGQRGTSGSSPTTSVTSTSVAATSTRALSTTPTATGVSLYGQCGGIGYTGPTSCVSGKCTVRNDYYFQCVPT